MMTSYLRYAMCIQQSSSRVFICEIHVLPAAVPNFGHWGVPTALANTLLDACVYRSGRDPFGLWSHAIGAKGMYYRSRYRVLD